MASHGAVRRQSNIEYPTARSASRYAMVPGDVAPDITSARYQAIILTVSSVFSNTTNDKYVTHYGTQEDQIEHALSHARILMRGNTVLGRIHRRNMDHRVVTTALGLLSAIPNDAWCRASLTEARA